MAGISLKDAEAARLEITREQAAEVQKLYRGVYRDMRRQLKGMTSGGATSSLRRSQLKHLTESLKTAYEGLGRQLEGNITSAVERTSQAVVDANTAWLSEAGLKIAEVYAYVPQDIVTMLASGKLYSDGWTLSKAIWGESQQKAREIDLIVAKGVAANKSAYEIAKDLESYVNPGALKPWDWSKVYPGTSKKVDYNAQRLARTMVSHAYQQSLERVCKKNPFVIGYKWRASPSARTCELCRERSETDHHGLGVGVYPKGELPLDHPNGMCTFLTVMSDSLNGISDRLADWAEGKEDPALDKWSKDMFPNTPSNKAREKEKDSGLEKDFKWLTQEQLEHPPEFMEFFSKLNWNERAEFIKWAGVGMSDSQAFQKLEQAYNSRIIAPTLKPVERVKKSVQKKEKVDRAPVTPKQIDQMLQAQSDGDTLSKLDSESKKWWSKLAPEQQKAISNYTGGNFKAMNEILRGVRGDDPYYRNLINQAQSAMDQYQTSEDLVVRRGSKATALARLLGLERDTSLEEIGKRRDEFIGAVAEDKGFFSTTPVVKGGFGGAVNYKIFVPQGANMPYLESFTMNPEEYETLLPPGSMFRVVDLEVHQAKFRMEGTIYLELIT